MCGENFFVGFAVVMVPLGDLLIGVVAVDVIEDGFTIIAVMLELADFKAWLCVQTACFSVSRLHLFRDFLL